MAYGTRQSLVAEEVDGSPSSAISKVVFPNGTLSITAGVATYTPAAGVGFANPMTTKGDIIIGDTGGTAIRKAVGTDGQVVTADAASTGGIKWATPSAGSALTVEEVDASPTDSAITKIVFPNGTLGISSHVATYTPAASGVTFQRPALTPATPTYDFAGAALDGAFSAHSSQGSFGTGNVMTQGMDWLGSSVELQFSVQMGVIYVAHADADLDFSVGGVRAYGLTHGAVMFGIAALDSAGTGIASLVYTDQNGYMASINTWNYGGNTDSWTGQGPNAPGGLMIGDYWFRLKRVSGTWTGYQSRSGRAWDKTFATRADAITVDKLVFGILYNTATSYSGRLTADWFHVAV